jgi:hypothetical protein
LDGELKIKKKKNYAKEEKLAPPAGFENPLLTLLREGVPNPTLPNPEVPNEDAKLDGVPNAGVTGCPNPEVPNAGFVLFGVLLPNPGEPKWVVGGVPVPKLAKDGLAGVPKEDPKPGAVEVAGCDPNPCDVLNPEEKALDVGAPNAEVVLVEPNAEVVLVEPNAEAVAKADELDVPKLLVPNVGVTLLAPKVDELENVP